MLTSNQGREFVNSVKVEQFATNLIFMCKTFKSIVTVLLTSVFSFYLN